MLSGFAFVDFYDWRDAEAAIRELDGGHLNGGDVKVSHAHGPSRSFIHDASRPVEPLLGSPHTERHERGHRRNRLPRTNSGIERNEQVTNERAADDETTSQQNAGGDNRYGDWLNTPLHSFREREVPRRVELNESIRQGENDRCPHGLSRGIVGSEEHWEALMQNAQETVERCRIKLRMIALRKRIAGSMSGGGSLLDDV